MVQTEPSGSFESKKLDIATFSAKVEEFNSTIPSLVAILNPDDESAKVQKQAFLADEVDNPLFLYPEIAAITDDTIRSYYEEAEQLILEVESLKEPPRSVYQEFVAKNLQKVSLIKLIGAYNKAEESEEKEGLASDFMRQNIECFGESDKTTYHSLLKEKVQAVDGKQRSIEAEAIFQELLSILPAAVLRSEGSVERFKPSEETIAWVHDVVMTLYEGLLRHVPDTDEMISAEQLCSIFGDIIREEFEDQSWKAVQKNGKAISVSAQSKTVAVPFSRAPVSAAEAKRLVVHELGVHMMTAMIGESTNIPALQFGLANYDDTQEGIAKVVEQALEGVYVEAGTDHYITAGLAYFDNMNFREAFEIKWRLELLDKLKPNETPSDEQIAVARGRAFDGPQVATTRIFRGTNDLPLFKDLSYFNGAAKVWEYLEKIRGDDLQLSLLLTGKRSLSQEHQRVALEAGSIV